MTFSAVARLRDATRPCHERVDAAYSGFDLAAPIDYGRFLQAHARATRAAEQTLHGDVALPAWRPRMPLLAGDLEDMSLTELDPIEFEPTGNDAWQWGVLYVLEGSRLGAGILVKRTAAGTPTAYLSSRHLSGEWRSLLAALDARGSALSPGWIDAAIVGASDCFDLYCRAAQMARAERTGPADHSSRAQMSLAPTPER